MKEIIPFGAKYTEILKPKKLPNPQEWTWKPKSNANLNIIYTSWPGRTCTNSCTDDRPDEMEDKFLKRL